MYKIHPVLAMTAVPYKTAISATYKTQVIYHAVHHTKLYLLNVSLQQNTTVVKRTSNVPQTCHCIQFHAIHSTKISKHYHNIKNIQLI